MTTSLVAEAAPHERHDADTGACISRSTAAPTQATSRGTQGTLTLFYWQAPTIEPAPLAVKDQSAS
jgi:hypothetical protein